MFVCEKCNQVAAVGEYYYFYQGTHTDTNRTFNGPEAIYSINTYPVKVCLCSKCVTPRIIMEAIKVIGNIILVTVSLSIGVLLANGGTIAFIIGCIGTISILYIVIRQIILPLYYQNKKNYNKVKQIISDKKNWEAGDKLAIKLKGKQSFSNKSNRLYFFTRNKLSSLRANKK
jgi:hypothetical protein